MNNVGGAMPATETTPTVARRPCVALMMARMLSPKNELTGTVITETSTGRRFAAPHAR